MYDTLYAILNKRENATLQYSIFFEKVLEEKYLLKLTSVFQISSKRFVKTPPICLIFASELCSLLCLKLSLLNYAIACANINCCAYHNLSYLCCIKTQENLLIPCNKRRNPFRIYQFCKKNI